MWEDKEQKQSYQLPLVLVDTVHVQHQRVHNLYKDPSGVEKVTFILSHTVCREDLLFGLCLSFLLAVTCVHDRPSYVAERLYKSMKVLLEIFQVLKSHVYMYIQCERVSNQWNQLLMNSTPENSLYGIGDTDLVFAICLRILYGFLIRVFAGLPIQHDLL